MKPTPLHKTILSCLHATPWRPANRMTYLGCALTALTVAHLEAASPFVSVPTPFPPVSNGGLAVGDFDNDGRLDVALSGGNKPVVDEPPTALCAIWRNTGNGFEKYFEGMPQLGAAKLEWVDVNNDGLLDLLLSGLTAEGEFMSEIWRNTGTSFVKQSELFFTVAGQKIAAVGALTSGDLDNDGKTDLLLLGSYDAFQFPYLFKNVGTGFVNQDPGQEVLYLGGITTGDFDNDGRLDYVVTGVAKRSPFDVSRSEVFRNTGSGFTSYSVLPAAWNGPVAVIDYNNDGREDVLISGSFADPYTQTPETHILLNTGSGFEMSPAVLPALETGSLDVADYNNDGLSDILMTGQGPSSGNSYQSVVLRGNVGGGFTTIQANQVGKSESVGAWIDFDQDGRLDFIQTGNRYQSDSTTPTTLWRNTEGAPNSPPSAPGNLSSSESNGYLRLTWDSATDSETPAAALTYNVRVGSQPGLGDIVSPLSGADGTRRVLAAGNARRSHVFLVKKDPLQTVYWSVQAVDGGLRGGAFAPESSAGLVSVSPKITRFDAEGNKLVMAFEATRTFKYQVEATPVLELEDSGTPTPWKVVGSATETSPGQFSFSDTWSKSLGARFYRVVEAK